MASFRDLLPALVWVVCLAYGIFFVYDSTNQRIQKFSISPPFRQENFSSQSSLNSLVDKNPETEWKTEPSSEREWDFSLELGLTHVWKKNQYSPADWSQVTIQSCPSQVPTEVKILFFKREAINVDKELRMPEETAQGQFQAIVGGGKTISLPLTRENQTFGSFPEGISILGVKLKSEKNLCLAEIQLKP